MDSEIKDTRNITESIETKPRPPTYHHIERSKDTFRIIFSYLDHRSAFDL